MQGIVIEGCENLPSLAINSGTIQKEDLFRYSKRNAQGEMRRISYIGYTLRIDCKWALLLRRDYERLLDTITGKDFYVSFTWQGAQIREKFYAGNISATPFRIKDGKPLYYRDVSFPAISVFTLEY